MKTLEIKLNSGNSIVGFTDTHLKEVETIFFSDVPNKPSFVYCYAKLKDDGDIKGKVVLLLYQDIFKLNPTIIRKIDTI